MKAALRGLVGTGIIFLLILASSFIPANIATAGSTTKTLSTNFTLVNLSSTADAYVTVSYHKTDGSVWDADDDKESFTISANYGQRIIAQYFDSTLSAGSGSVVVNSSEPLGAVVQIQARNQTPTMGAYSGFDAGSEKFFIPTLIRERQTASGLASSQIIIQNTASSATNTVTIDFIAYPGSGYSNWQKAGISIPPNASYYYDLADEDVANLPPGWFGSAVATSEPGKPIAVVSNLFAGPNGLATFNAFPQESLGTLWYVPQFTSRLPNGLSMPVTVQNLGTVDIEQNALVMTCNSSISTPASFELRNSVAIPPNGSYAFNPVTDLTIPSNWSGACRVEAPVNIVVIVQMRRPDVTEEFAGYEAFNGTTSSTRVVIPLVSKRQPNGFATAVIIQNLDTDNAADVKLSYIPSEDYVAGGGSSSTIVVNHQIPPGENLIQNHRLADGVPELPDQWYGTLLVEPQNPATARPIAAYVQLTNYLTSEGDTLMAHAAFGLP